MNVKKFALTLDLKNDPTLIAEYKKYHQKVWPEILDGIRSVGILNMEIFLLGNRLMMVMEVPDGFDFDTQMAKLATLPRQQEWEALMNTFQQPLPGSRPGEKWLVMEKIFQL